MTLLKKILNFRLYGKKKLLLSFEYGVVLAQVAHTHDVEIDSEFMTRAEKMIENEFKTRPAEDLAIDMGSNMMSVFELDLSK